jgi:hypothetical protein
LKTYCAAAFRQIYSDNAGRYRLCCHSASTPSLEQYNTRKTSPFEYFLSDEMEAIREQMLSGEKVRGCEPCYNLENRGHKSWRQWKYNSTYPLTANVERVSLKLRIHGSYCNLGCYMCFPYNSSTRRQHLKENNIDWKNDAEKVVNITTGRYEQVVADILNNIHLVDRLDITGGEPLLLPRMWQFIDKIPDEYAKDITLNFYTNLTQLEFQQWNVWQLVKRFKQVKLAVSCDHYGDKLAWIRYPIDVKQFEDNLNTARSLIADINVTVSILNINDLLDIEKYYKDFNVTFTGVVFNPKYLSIRNIPDQLKAKYKQIYAHLPNVISELDNSIIPGQLQAGLEYCRTLNSMRNINFNKTFEHILRELNE